MAKVVKWENKNKKGNHEYHSVMGQTDYDIPVFGYKSSFIILISIVLTLFIIPMICDAIHIDYRMPTVILGGLASGFSAVYTQFFIERKKGFTKSFWVVGTLLSLFCGMIIFVLVYTGIVL